MRYWNILYPQGNTDGKPNPQAVKVFKDSIGSNIAKYRDSWRTLVRCLSGQAVDCIFSGQNALQILLRDGQPYMRPNVLMATVQYYFLLLQKSSVAICAYTQ